MDVGKAPTFNLSIKSSYMKKHHKMKRIYNYPIENPPKNHQVYIPLLPMAARDVLLAPVPFFVGLTSELKEGERDTTPRLA
eukprot:1273799-Amorphochlora_amoeboformis.AAC.1